MSVPFAGTSPAGFLVPIQYSVEGEPPAFLADAIDPSTGEYLSIEQGFDPTDAWVLTQLSIDRYSGSAVQNDGRDFSDVTHVDQRRKRILEQEIRRPLETLVSLREIEITSLRVEEFTDAFDAKLSYVQLQTGVERDNVSVPLGNLTAKAVA